MKRLILLLSQLIGMATFSIGSAQQQPIYFVVDLNINYFTGSDLQLNSSNLIKHIQMLRRYGIQGEYYFTGLAAAAINQFHPEVIDTFKANGLYYNHHGANRPPRPQPIDRVKGVNWEQDVKAILDYESYAVDPVTGVLDSTKVGGMKGMMQIFGDTAFSTGRFFEASILHAEKQFGVKMCAGLKGNTGASTESGWFLGILNRPDDERLFIGPQLFKPWALGQTTTNLLTELDHRIAQTNRSQPHLMMLVMHDHDFFQGYTQAQQDSLWSHYAQVLSWAVRNPNLTIVRIEDIYNAVVDDRTKEMTMSQLASAAQNLLDAINSTGSVFALPEYITVGNDYLSLCDLCQMLVSSLSIYGRTGTFPNTATARDILGPTVITAISSLSVSLNRSEVVSAADSMAMGMVDRVPSQISVGGRTIDAAEFLYLLAQAFLQIYHQQTATTVSLRDINPVTAQANSNTLADNLTKLQFWTFKPLRWKSTTPVGVNDSDAGREAVQPSGFQLYQNYPNPFNPSTVISFQLSVNSHVTLKVFDVNGREVATLFNSELTPGEHSVVFDAKGLASGVYFYRLSARQIPTSRDGQAGNFVVTKKMLMIR